MELWSCVAHQANKCQKTSWLGSLVFCPARLTQAHRAIHLWVRARVRLWVVMVDPSDAAGTAQPCLKRSFFYGKKGREKEEKEEEKSPETSQAA